MKKKISIFSIINFLLISAFCTITLIPFIHVLSVSLSDEILILQGKIGIFPKGINFEYYKAILAYPMVSRGYLNTLKYVSLGVSINMIMTVLLAYPLSRPDFRMRGFLSWFIALTMFFSGGLIPLFLVVINLGMYDTTWAMVIPGAISTFNVIILRTYFQNIPQSLIDAGKIDGCKELQVLWHIVLPSSVSGLATIGLFYMVGHWNSFLNGYMFLQDSMKHPMQLVLRKIVIVNQTIDLRQDSSPGFSDGIQYAVIIITVLPIVMVYPFIQKYFRKGLMIGSVKG